MVDKKRISGPENSIIISKIKNLKRERRGDQLRPLYFDQGLVKNATGSCFLEQGNQKIICSVFGPKQSMNTTEKDISFDFKFAPFSTLARRGYQKDEQEKEFSLALEQALSPVIRTDLLEGLRLEIFCLVLEADGSNSALASSITCCTLALINAGIQMYDLCIGSSIGFTTQGALIDLCEDEEIDANGHLVIATMPSLNQITLVIQSGHVAVDDSCEVWMANQAIQTLVDACHQMSTTINAALIK